MTDTQMRRAVRDHFEQPERVSSTQQRLRSTYLRTLRRTISEHVEPGARILDLGCGDGSLLASLKPSFGVGVDLSSTSVAAARRSHPGLRFVQGDVEHLPMAGAFDYIILSNVVGFLFDVVSFFRELAPCMRPGTRVIVTHYNYAWEPILKFAQRLGLKHREPLQNWLSAPDLRNILELAGLEPVSMGYRAVMPFGPRALAAVVNRIAAAIPLLDRLGIISVVVARNLRRDTRPRVTSPSVSVIIPTRNERGNVAAALDRMPALGSHTQIVFVDGRSTDGTTAEIEAQMAARTDIDIVLMHQQGKGKGDAVRMGFEAAEGDILMILDADLTVPPEDLPLFYDALVQERGELVIGSRLVYPMEQGAMRIANVAGNKLFSLAFTWIVQTRITDTLCGTKVLWASDYEKIARNRHRFGDFDPFGDFDLLFGAAGIGLRIREVPIHYRERKYGRTNIDRWRHGVILLRMAILGARKLRLS